MPPHLRAKTTNTVKENTLATPLLLIARQMNPRLIQGKKKYNEKIC